MKKIMILLLFSVSTYFDVDAQSRKKIKISGDVTFTHIYKGGAAPSDEVLQRCCSPKKYAGKKLYVKKNYYSKVLYTIQTDSSGRFTACLRAGKHKLYLNNEINEAKSEALNSGKGDEQMLWLTEPYYELEVTKNGERHFIIGLRERMNDEIPKP